MPDAYINSGSYYNPNRRRLHKNSIGVNLTLTGKLLLPAGSAGAPSLASSGDPDTGLFWGAADTLIFATGGVERWSVDAAGAFKPRVSNTYDLGTAAFTIKDIRLAGVLYGVNLQLSSLLTIPNFNNGSGVINWRNAANGSNNGVFGDTGLTLNVPLTLTTQARARLSSTTGQQSGITPAFLLTFANEDFDTDAMVVPGGSRITFNTPGTYVVRVLVYAQTAAVGGAAALDFVHSGGQIRTHLKYPALANTLETFEASETYVIPTAGQYVDLKGRGVLQTATFDKSLPTFFEAFRLY